MAGRTGSRLLAEPYRVNEAGLPGMRTRMAITSARGVNVEDEVTMLFRDETNYVFTCQSRPDRATEMTAGCGKVLESFRGKPVAPAEAVVELSGTSAEYVGMLFVVVAIIAAISAALPLALVTWLARPRWPDPLRAGRFRSTAVGQAASIQE